MADNATEPKSTRRDSFLHGLKHGALNSFYGFMIGGFVTVVSSLYPTSPSWLTYMPLIGMVGGLAFGFGVGMDE